MGFFFICSLLDSDASLPIVTALVAAPHSLEPDVMSKPLFPLRCSQVFQLRPVPRLKVYPNTYLLRNSFWHSCTFFFVILRSLRVWAKSISKHLFRFHKSSADVLLTPAFSALSETFINNRLFCPGLPSVAKYSNNADSKPVSRVVSFSFRARLTVANRAQHIR